MRCRGPPGILVPVETDMQRRRRYGEVHDPRRQAPVDDARIALRHGEQISGFRDQHRCREILLAAQGDAALMADAGKLDVFQAHALWP